MTFNGNVKTKNPGNQSIKDVSMAAMSLLRHNPKKLLKQAKRLVKQKPKLAREIFCADVEGWTLIHACALRGSKSILKTLLSCDVDVNFPMGSPEGLPSNSTCLHLAAYRGDIKIMDYLLSNNADIHSKDSQGNEPIYYAIKRSHTEAILFLQNRGACSDNYTSDNDQAFACEVTTPEPKVGPFCFSFHLGHHSKKS